jgi:hypothetical protein
MRFARCMGVFGERKFVRESPAIFRRRKRMNESCHWKSKRRHQDMAQRKAPVPLRDAAISHRGTDTASRTIASNIKLHSKTRLRNRLPRFRTPQHPSRTIRSSQKKLQLHAMPLKQTTHFLLAGATLCSSHVFHRQRLPHNIRRARPPHCIGSPLLLGRAVYHGRCPSRAYASRQLAHGHGRLGRRRILAPLDFSNGDGRDFGIASRGFWLLLLGACYDHDRFPRPRAALGKDQASDDNDYGGGRPPPSRGQIHQERIAPRAHEPPRCLPRLLRK